MDLEIKPKQYRRDKKTRRKKKEEWRLGEIYRDIIDSIEQASKPYIYTFEFDKFSCVAFNNNTTLSNKKDIIVHIEDKKMVLNVKDIKKALNIRNNRVKVGLNYKTGNDIFLEFIDGYIQLECLKTNESDLKKAIKLVEHKLCKN